MEIKRALELVDNLIEDRLQNPGRHDPEITEAVALLRNIGEISLEQLDPTVLEQLEAGGDTLYDYMALDYIENNGVICPFCNSDQLTVLEDIDPETGVQSVKCENCKRKWDEVFVLAGINYGATGFRLQLSTDGITEEGLPLDDEYDAMTDDNGDYYEEDKIDEPDDE